MVALFPREIALRPPYSVILFTAASGAGYGLLALMGFFGATGLLPAGRGFGITGYALALGLVTFGLIASTRHPGNPKRAWRALSQWRSSWLTRADVLAAGVYVPALLSGFGWIALGSMGGLWGFLGVLTAILAGLTVYCTAMVYASQPHIPAWNNHWAVINFLALALMTGALALNALAQVHGVRDPQISLLVVATLFLGFYVKRRYWKLIGIVEYVGEDGDEDSPASSEQVRNFRRVAFLGLFAAPLLLSLFAMEVETGTSMLMTVAAAASAAVGVLAERWLFFAEAGPVATLEFGKETA